MRTGEATPPGRDQFRLAPMRRRAEHQPPDTADERLQPEPPRPEAHRPVAQDGERRLGRGAGVRENESPHTLGRHQGGPQRDHAAHRQPGPDGAPDAEIVEDGQMVVHQVVEVDAGARGARLPVAARVDVDGPVGLRQHLDLRRPHRPGAEEAVGKQHARSGPLVLEVNAGVLADHERHTSLPSEWANARIVPAPAARPSRR